MLEYSNRVSARWN